MICTFKKYLYKTTNSVLNGWYRIVGMVSPG